ncbi:MAG: phage holin family protein [Actinomycetota bacterium]|nr:phage holin family protein [Actinomycetota bacterium]
MTGTQPRTGRHAKSEPPPAVPAVPLSPVELPQLADVSLGDLVREAATHFSTLFRSEVELAKAEVTREVRKGVKGSVFFAVALTVLLFSLFFLFITVAEVIAIWLPQWAGFGIVFGLMLAASGGFALLGWRRMRSIRKPERTISTVRDTGAALTRRRSADGSSADGSSADPLTE